MAELELARRVVTQADFDLFAEVSGDDNPIHVDPGFSARTRFGRTVSHGMLLYSWAWALIKEAYPGMVPDHAQLMFPNPTFAGDEIAFVLFDEDGPQSLKLTVYRTADDTEAMLLETGLKEAQP